MTNDRVFLINLSTSSNKLLRFLLHPHTQRHLLIDLLLRRALGHVLRDLRSGRSVRRTPGKRASGFARSSKKPVLNSKSLNPAKVRLIIGNDSAAIRQG